MKYTIYKITNKVNNKIYIGKHQTKDPNDGYMGSGKMLRRAQKKYGIENFIKEILYIFDTEDEMNAKEKELVTEEFCLREDTYNICIGGQGGFSYINNNTLYDIEQRRLAGKSSMAKLRKKRPDIFSIEASRERTKKRWQQGVYQNNYFKTNPLKGEKNHKSRSVMDENGVVYPSIRALADAKGLHKDAARKKAHSGVYTLL